MPLLGAHVSAAGGLAQALYRGKKAGCQVIQIFTCNPARWHSRDLSESEIEDFHNAGKDTSVIPVAAHDSYLINMASPRSEIREKSFTAFLNEMKRAEVLLIPYVVMHPGSHMGEGEKAGIEHISDSLKKIVDMTGDSHVKILLETTAGQGNNLGYSFEQLGRIIEQTDAPERMGICMDTCHVFAAGYDFRTAVTYNELIRRFDETIGLHFLKLFHLNDSKKDCGSRVDRHEQLGHGFIGKEALALFLRDPRFNDLPFLIETPKGKNDKGIDWDVANLDLLRSLCCSGPQVQK